MSWQAVYARLGMSPADVQWHHRAYRAAYWRGIMEFIAYHSSQLECYDQWLMHAQALATAYQSGKDKKPLTMYEFLSWHRAILPFGGSLRECNALPFGGFTPALPADLPRLINAFVRDWNGQLNGNPMLSLSRLHIDQYHIHPFPDGNKRHCRLLTVYGCGWYDLPPVCIQVSDKPVYMDALNDADRLADLFTHRLLT